MLPLPLGPGLLAVKLSLRSMGGILEGYGREWNDDACFNGGSAGAFDFARLHSLQCVGRIAGQSLQQVALGVAALSRLDNVNSTFMLPSVTNETVCNH